MNVWLFVMPRKHIKTKTKKKVNIQNQKDDGSAENLIKVK